MLGYLNYQPKQYIQHMFLQQLEALKSSYPAKWTLLSNTSFLGWKKKKKIFLSCRLYGMWSIRDSKLEKDHFGAILICWTLPAVTASNTVKFLTISTVSLSHFVRWLYLKWYHGNDSDHYLSVTMLVCQSS